jgi:hypothetical protein
LFWTWIVMPVLNRFRPSYLALSISLISGSALAANYTINNVQTATNGGNTLDGSDRLTVTADGSIDTTTTDVHAIQTTGGSNTIDVAGSLITDAFNKYGIINSGGSDIITLTGNITTSGQFGYGMFSSDDGNTVTIAGSIVTTGQYGYGFFNNSGDYNVLTISGRIVTSGQYGEGIHNSGSNNTIYVTGSIAMSGDESRGISTIGSDNVINVTGSISASGDDASLIRNSSGHRNRYEIYGSLSANGANSYAINNYDGLDNLYVIHEGARIIGDLQTYGDSATSGTLRFDVGSAMSYVFTTSTCQYVGSACYNGALVNDWTLEDLDGRSVVAGSAMAAGIGNAETADELQYLRLSQITHSLLNRADRYALVDGERQAWADPFYFNSERDASSTDATIEDYDADGYGLTVGLPIVLKGLDADVILGVQETALDIHSGTQNIDVTSLRAGLYFPNLLTRDAIRVSGKALIGYNQHDMDRQVLVNSNTTTGITTYTADYDSWEAVAGLEAEHSQPLGTGATMLTASLGADLVYEAIESYDETANFHWDSRDLLQGVAKASIGLHHVHTNGMKTYAIASVQARDVLDGKTTDYAINGTAVNFSGGDFNDTITQLNLGATYQAKDNLQLGLNLQAARSDNDIDSYAASARVNWKF